MKNIYAVPTPIGCKAFEFDSEIKKTKNMKAKSLPIALGKFNKLLSFILLFLLLAGFSNTLKAQTVSISTDKDDYSPGTYVIITGSGWQNDSLVQLTLTHLDPLPDPLHTHESWNVTPSLDGYIYYEWHVDTQELNTSFQLDALGLTSGLSADTYFTDAANKVSSLTIDVNQTGNLFYSTAGSVTYNIAITPNGGSTGGSTTLSLSGTALPIGTIVTWQGGSSTITLPAGSTTVINVTLTLTSTNTMAAGTTSGITNDASGPPVKTSGSTTFKITPKALSITAPTIASKVYDGSATSGPVTVGTLSGFVSPQTVTATAVGSYLDANVGAGKTATVVYTLANGTNGGIASNYSLANGTAAGDITAKALTVTGATTSNKVYDGSTTAAITGGSLIGVVSPDVVNLTQSGTYADKNVGTAKSITSTCTISGASASNYTLTQPALTARNITAKTLTITGVTANNKVYDATMAATLNTASAALSGLVTGDDVTLNSASASGTFATKIVGNTKPVTITGFTITGADAGNYSLTQPTATANITALPITGSITASNKVYDGAVSATIATRTLSGVITPDVVTYTGGTATFADKNVATGKTVTATFLSLTGADAVNYTVNTTAATTADITARSLTITAAPNTKTYDGTTTAAAVPTVTSGVIQTGDLANFTETYDTRNAGTGKALTAAGTVTDGNGGNNYTYSFVTNTAGVITPRALSIINRTSYGRHDPA